MTHFYCVHEAGGHHGNGDEKYWHSGITNRNSFQARSPRYEYCILWEDFGDRANAARFEETCRCYIPWIFAEHCIAWSSPVNWLAPEFSFWGWHTRPLWEGKILPDGTINLYGTTFFRYHENYPASIDSESLREAFLALVSEWRSGRLEWINQQSYRRYGAGRKRLIESIRASISDLGAIEKGKNLVREVILASEEARKKAGLDPDEGILSRLKDGVFSAEKARNDIPNPTEGDIEAESPWLTSGSKMDPQRQDQMKEMLERNRHNMEALWKHLLDR